MPSTSDKRGARRRHAPRRCRHRSTSFALLLLLAGSAACQATPRPNILLIVVDTLRADRLRAYGQTRDLAPFLDSLAERGVVFQNTYAPSSWTSPSVASLFTSRYQSQHGILSFGSTLADGEHTLAEQLRAAGYATGAFSANYLIDAKRGYAQGFDQYRVFAAPSLDASGRRRFGKARAARLRDASAAWLDQCEKTRPGAPLFLYLHYMEPHNPYEPEAEFLERVLGGRRAADRDTVNQRMLASNVGEFSDPMLQGVRDYYDAEVMSLDADLRQLFTTLRRRGFLDNAIVVITSDHGEEHREHARVGHGQTLYQEVLRVPLIILAPGDPQPRLVSSLVSLLDIAPTVLALAGLEERTPPSFVGQSLAADMGIAPPWWRFWRRGASGERRDLAFGELLQDESERLAPHERAVISAEDKMIATAGGQLEFYSLATDAGEGAADALSADARERLSQALHDFVARFGDSTQSAAPTLSAETIERMRALGYRQDDSPPPPAASGDAGERSRPPRLYRLLAAALLALVSIGLAACTRSEAPNIVVIVADTLRADRLGAYGSKRGLTPFLDSLSERAFVFRNAYAQTSWTSPSIATLFTSRYPSQHRIVSFRSRLAEEENTLGEILARSGYSTSSFSANMLLNPLYGYWQGFDHHRVFVHPRVDQEGQPTFGKTRAAEVNQAALTWLAQRPENERRAPVFLYLHFMEPHTPYDPEPAFLAHVLDGRAAADRVALNKRALLANLSGCSDELLQSIEDYYNAEVMSLDAQLRDLFAALAERGVLDNSIVVITADHGEELREHDAIGHGTTLHEEVLRIPLLMLVTGNRQRVDIDALVSMIDVAPTLLDLSGAAAAPPSFAGRSLRSLMHLPAPATAKGSFPQADDESVVIGELLKENPQRHHSLRQRTLITATGKLIDGEGDEARFYDLARDPGESDPRALQPPARSRLREELAAFTARLRSPPVEETPPPLDDETLERMRALGYHE